MKEFLNNNKYSLVLGVFTLLLGGIAIATALRLYQLRTTVPTDTGATAQHSIQSCQILTIPLTIPDPSPSEDPTEDPTEEPTDEPTDEPTTAATETPKSCDVACDSDQECKDIDPNYVCFSATRTCRHINYPQENDCQAPPTSTSSPTEDPTNAATATQKPTDVSQASTTPVAELPEAGVSLPTILGISVAALLLVGAMLLAL